MSTFSRIPLYRTVCDKPPPGAVAGIRPADRPRGQYRTATPSERMVVDLPPDAQSSSPFEGT